MRTLLVLGGTGEGRALAAALTGLRVVSSLAGRVAAPRLPVGEVRIGGFGGVPGLLAYLRREAVDAVVDATHPFAGRITANAFAATREAGVPFLLLRRPGWTPVPGDDWHWVDSVREAAAAVAGRRAFITTGRQELAAFASGVARTVDPPDPPVPGVQVLLDRGPYTVDGELELLRAHGIEVVVTKDSGGAMTAAKLAAARHLGLPVVLVRRPPVPDAPSVGTVGEAVAWLTGGSGAG
ncbi:cobalt-precorrin-6A reductase [Saccharothrix violaceirubra]|uniref:Precorrin-6A/cobalt-precorrin-6A reductase n=1 Tax=Saccharothrix violaceirubra TaxID=413306 RepID=A0A7W7WX79_9PSEU|nr:cobalt-precorrin-6A reductase [Saccharothrix violaceirubra]MBB4967115.1 precorrin-6A/cobalt-precorrin-6A reductase [Saccharothrix violaceirubra]